ncbi:MAG: ABC transporter ATP-binding protein [Deltaproteobacteria bacterium]|nr:ABC transporter ATP-binding protein [Deltaproteobacteria bacterium]
MISVKNVSKYYGSVRAVENLSFEVKQGECVGFLGLNGAGKSTVLQLLSCLLLPTSGRVTISGFDVVDDSHEIRRFVGYLPEVPPLYPEMTTREYIEFAGRIRGLSRAQTNERTRQVLEICDLEKVEDSTIGTLSYGYKQRVGIAQAIVHSPRLLILDEPIQGLDPVQIVEMRKMIGELRGEHTILLSTHILSEIEHTCDRILMMQDGRIAAEGTEQELEQRYGASRRIDLEVRGSEATLRSALASLSPNTLTHLSIEKGDSEILFVRLQVPEAAREQLSRAVVNAGLGLLSMKAETTGLESIFVRLSALAVGSSSPPSPASLQSE